MIGNCNNCRYWGKTDGGGIEYNKVWTVCGYIRWPEPTDPIGESEAALYAYASDDSGLEVDLRTGPNFGCTNFEEKVCQ